MTHSMTFDGDAARNNARAVAVCRRASAGRAKGVNRSLRPVARGQMVRGGRSGPSATLCGARATTGGKPALEGGEDPSARGGGGAATVRLHAAHKLHAPAASCEAGAFESCDTAASTLSCADS